jgi:hypothetical protein
MLCYTVGVMLAAVVEVMFYKSVVGGRSTTSLSGLWRNQPYSNCCNFEFYLYGILVITVSLRKRQQIGWTQNTGSQQICRCIFSGPYQSLSFP